MSELRQVVVVGGGFAGVAAAKKLASDPRVQVTLVDRHDYHQFQPLLYQVATSRLAAADVVYPIRNMAKRRPNLDVKLGTVVSVDPKTRSVTTAEGQTYGGDFLVAAAGSQPDFFDTGIGLSAQSFTFRSPPGSARCFQARPWTSHSGSLFRHRLECLATRRGRR